MLHRLLLKYGAVIDNTVKQRLAEHPGYLRELEDFSLACKNEDKNQNSSNNVSSLAQIKLHFTLSLLTSFSTPIKELLSLNKSWNGFVRLIQSLSNKLEKGAEKLISLLPTSTQELAKSFVKSSTPIILATATVKPCVSFYNSVQSGKSTGQTIFNILGEFCKTIVQGEIALLGATAGAIAAETLVASVGVGAAIAAATTTLVPFATAGLALGAASIIANKSNKSLNAANKKFTQMINASSEISNICVGL
ncbi:MAG: hypothetical protein ACK4OM_01225 [Alphaproteobacteria bacterium]